MASLDSGWLSCNTLMRHHTTTEHASAGGMYYSNVEEALLFYNTCMHTAGSADTKQAATMMQDPNMTAHLDHLLPWM
jgi:hypothetical protein